MKILFLLFLTLNVVSYEWLVKSKNNTLTKDQRFTKIYFPLTNFNLYTKVLGQESIFIAPSGGITALDLSYEFCSTFDIKLKKDEPKLWNSTITDPCFQYFSSSVTPFYLRGGVNSTTNYTHLAVQQFCTNCEISQSQGFTDEIGRSTFWYNKAKCANMSNADQLCLLYYPVSRLSPFTILYFWDSQEFMLSGDAGLRFVLWWFNYGVKVLFTFTLFGILILLFLYVIPEISNIIQVVKREESTVLSSTFTIKNLISALLCLAFLSTCTGGWISFLMFGLGLQTFDPYAQGPLYYISLVLNLFCFTLVIIKWKQISDSSSINDEFTKTNK